MDINITKRTNKKDYECSAGITSNGKKTILVPTFKNKNEERVFSRVTKKQKSRTNKLELKRININI